MKPNEISAFDVDFDHVPHSAPREAERSYRRPIDRMSDSWGPLTRRARTGVAASAPAKRRPHRLQRRHPGDSEPERARPSRVARHAGRRRSGRRRSSRPEYRLDYPMRLPGGRQHWGVGAIVGQRPTLWYVRKSASVNRWGIVRTLGFPVQIVSVHAT
jgi:hypothetical protein